MPRSGRDCYGSSGAPATRAFQAMRPRIGPLGRRQTRRNDSRRRQTHRQWRGLKPRRGVRHERRSRSGWLRVPPQTISGSAWGLDRTQTALPAGTWQGRWRTEPATDGSSLTSLGSTLASARRRAGAEPQPS